MSHVDPAAIGRFAEEFVRPVRQQSRMIPLASVNMTISDVADALSRAANHKKTVSVSYLSPEEVAAQKDVNPFVASQRFLNEREHLVDLEKVGSYGIELGSVEGILWAREGEAGKGFGIVNAVREDLLAGSLMSSLGSRD
jgi:hypothetical protein